MTEVKVRLVTQHHAEGAERMRQELEVVKSGRKTDLNEVLGATGVASEEAQPSPEG